MSINVCTYPYIIDAPGSKVPGRDLVLLNALRSLCYVDIAKIRTPTLTKLKFLSLT